MRRCATKRISFLNFLSLITWVWFKKYLIFAFYRRKTDNFRLDRKYLGGAEIWYRYRLLCLWFILYNLYNITYIIYNLYNISNGSQYWFASLAVIAVFRFTSGFPGTSGHTTPSKPGSFEKNGSTVMHSLAPIHAQKLSPLKNRSICNFLTQPWLVRPSGISVP